MGCCDTKYADGICEVHRLVKSDSTLRKVAYCKTCKAFICKACFRNYPARFIAAIKKITE